MSKPVPTYRLYREETGESGDFWIHSETIPVRTHLHNWHIAQHRHDGFFQLFHLTAGTGEIHEPDGATALKAPCAVFIPPGAVHGFSYSLDIDGLVVTALGDRLRSLAAADRHIANFTAKTRVIHLDHEKPDAAYAAECIERLHDEVHGMSSSRLLLLEPLMTGAIVALARAGNATQDGQLSAPERKRLDLLTTLVIANLRTPKPSEFYANALGISTTHLNRLTRQATGLSLLGLIAMHIIKAARRDLVFTPTPVQAIAYSLGFSDPAYFSRFFRKHTGMSPVAFRAAERRRLTIETS